MVSTKQKLVVNTQKIKESKHNTKSQRKRAREGRNYKTAKKQLTK